MSSEVVNSATANNGAVPADPKPKSAAKVRKRAAKACLSCRARKVRCDVSQRGRPCMNCYLDNESCVVTGRASRFRRQQHDGAEAEASNPPYVTDSNKVRTAEDVVRSRDNGEPPSPQDRTMHTHDGDSAHQHCDTQTQRGVRESTPRASAPRDHQPSISTASDAGSVASSAAPNTQPPAFRAPISMPLKTAAGSLNSFPPESGPFWTGEQRAVANVDITYSYYPFLVINNLHVIMPQDVNYLEAQGCLRVPTRRILDEFVQQYFLHVHPILPLLNEGDFWDMYCHQGTSGPDQKIPLVILFAIMFSSCNFVSLSSIKALGYANLRDARATLYRRTKLLYDFDTESSLICLAQTAILLSYWSPNWAQAAKKPNSSWLSIAIQNAKSAEAHLQSALPSFSPIHQPVEYKKQNTLKRLWWCCVLRDRILPLGLRRSIQISRAHFDLDANTGLGYADLADEIDRSKVYNSEAKRSLIDLLVHLVDLCSVLTDLLTLVYPMDDSPGWHRQSPDEGAKIKGCKLALRRWYKGATMRFPMFGGGSVPRLTPGSGREFQHESVILYTNLMYMYYHSARVILCHHEVLQIAVASATPNLNSNLKEFANIYENRHELQDAASGVTECLKELIQLGLARWLPISAVACTALPLVLHIIDVRLSAANKSKGLGSDPNSQSAVKQHRLNILIEAMRTYQPQFDGVDYVSEAIRHIVNLAQLESMPHGARAIESGQPITEWADILSSQPGFYLRIVLTMDLALSKGRLPDETDFPVSLRGLFTGGVHNTASGTAASAASTTTKSQPVAHVQFPGSNMSHTHNHHHHHHHHQQSFFAPAPNVHIPPGTVRSISSDDDANSPAGTHNEFYQQQHNVMGGVGGMLNLNDAGSFAHSHHAPPSTYSNDTMSMADGMIPPPPHDMSSLFNDVLDIDNLAGEVLTAYNLNADDGTPPSAHTGGTVGGEAMSSSEQGDFDEDEDDELGDMDMNMYDSEDRGMMMKEGDWIGQAWTDDYLKDAAGEGMNVVGMGGGGGGQEDAMMGASVHGAGSGSAPGASNGGGGGGGDQETVLALLSATHDDGVRCH